ncbi:hypothetical protein FK216_06150 [Moraxellaceae bacterium AER2_44_116]|nr:hypothetical protein [Moraxellaceae bacterium]TQC98437.1 hypothetical protein FK216_06150 [Moraxellaceae bacterium AER2_44_116]
MIPEVKILKKYHYRSGAGESSYNPRTLITRILAPKTHSESSTIIEQSFEYNATLIHERVHWMQHHGTSFGAFLDAIRFSQGDTTVSWLRSMPADRVQKLIKERFFQGKPILRIDRSSQQPIYGKETESDELDLYRQIWFDHQWVHATFEDSSICDEIGVPPTQAIGEVIADVMIDLCINSRFKSTHSETVCTNPITPRKWYKFPDQLRFVRLGDSRLTSRMLMEAAATISEVQLFKNGAWSRALDKKQSLHIIKKRLHSLLKGQYGVALRILLTHCEVNESDILDFLPTASALCFAALNPPVPPYVIAPPPNAIAWQWADIYPPIRFTRLCEVVRKIGILNEIQARDHFLLSNYISKLCEVANLPSTLDLNYPEFTPQSTTPDFTDRTCEYPDTLALTHQDYNFWVQSQLSQLRRRALPLLVSLGNCLSGDLLKEHMDLFLDQGDFFIPYAESPLHWSQNERIGFRCPSNFGNWLVRSVAMHDALFDFVVGVGEFDLSDYPPDIQCEKMQEMLKTNITNGLINNRNSS